MVGQVGRLHPAPSLPKDAMPKPTPERLLNHMPQTRHERLPGESEVDFSARMALIQSKAMQERKRDADIASQAGYEEAAYSDSPLAKFKRVWKS